MTLRFYDQAAGRPASPPRPGIARTGCGGPGHVPQLDRHEPGAGLVVEAPSARRPRVPFGIVQVADDRLAAFRASVTRVDVLLDRLGVDQGADHLVAAVE
jgi:hypothetical protein